MHLVILMGLSGIEKKVNGKTGNGEVLTNGSGSAGTGNLLSLGLVAGTNGGGNLQTEKIIARIASQKDEAYYAGAAAYVRRTSGCVLSSLKRSFKLYDEVVYGEPSASRLMEIESKLSEISGFLKMKLGERLSNLDFEGKLAGSAEHDAAFGLGHHVKTALAGPFTALQTFIRNESSEPAKTKQIGEIQEKANGILKLYTMLEKIDSTTVKELLKTDNNFWEVKSKPPARVPHEFKMPTETLSNFTSTSSSSTRIAELLFLLKERSPDHREQALKFLRDFQTNFSPELSAMADTFSKIMEAARDGKSSEDVSALFSKLANSSSKIMVGLPSNINIEMGVLSEDGAADAAAGLGHILGQAASLAALQKVILTPPAERGSKFENLERILSRLKSIGNMLGTLEQSPDNARYFLMTEIRRDPDIQNVFLTPQF